MRKEYQSLFGLVIACAGMYFFGKSTMFFYGPQPKEVLFVVMALGGSIYGLFMGIYARRQEAKLTNLIVIGFSAFLLLSMVVYLWILRSLPHD